jgi:hypothetical protein
MLTDSEFFIKAARANESDEGLEEEEELDTEKLDEEGLEEEEEEEGGAI